MKRIISFVAITVIIMLLIPASVSASYGTCLRCGSTNTYERWNVTEGGTKTWDRCWYEKRDYYRACSNCGYQSFVTSDAVGPFHSISYQDLGCSSGVHTWNRYCTQCGYSQIQRVQCPGPPRCVSPW